ncbi:MAG: hypothetical protein HYR94_24015 [Chloroflexi bacterium]|nr:hypothetical protein [Chloroflexota bacterium]
MSIKEIVDRIKLLPESFVDVSYRQGRDKVLKQLNKRTGENESAWVDVFIEDSQNTIQKLIQKVTPYIIPDDYIYFLEFYGGLAIESNDYYFSLLGIGPMVEEWYTGIESDDAFPEPEKYGFLSLGSLDFRKGKYKFQHVNFFLDLAGVVQKHCVIGVGPWGEDDPNSFKIIKDIHAYPHRWQRVANSFTEWLELAAETRGIFVYGR